MTRVHVRALAAGLGLAIVLLATGCPRVTVRPLEGDGWLLAAFEGSPAPSVPPLGSADRANTTIRFERLTTDAATDSSTGRVTGSTGCNTYSGTYERTGKRLTIGSLTSTEMACESPVAEVEQAFLARLPQVASYHYGASFLVNLDAADGTSLMGFVPLITVTQTTTAP